MNRPCYRIPRALAALAISVGCLATSGGTAVPDEKIGQRPAVANAGQAEDEKAIRATAAALAKAFNAGDAKAIAALFTPDADYVDDDGQVFKGRAEIEKEFALAFARQLGLTLEITIDSIRFLGKDVALENGVARVKRAAGGRASASRYTAVLARRDGKWLMESVRESPYVPESNSEYLDEIEWLVGTWAAQTGTVTIELKCDWTANRNFLLRTITAKSGAGILSTVTQIIGWDPAKEQVRSWTFDSDGGFGSEFWVKDGKKWVLEATGMRRDGSETAATNVITQVDGDTFTWQSVSRRVDGDALPDTTLLKATRIKTKK